MHVTHFDQPQFNLKFSNFYNFDFGFYSYLFFSCNRLPMAIDTTLNIYLIRLLNWLPLTFRGKFPFTLVVIQVIGNT